tara:strand:- start:1028 stop:1309 length:282 start_codon:yes stop_codon:yes gene_type:complete
MSEENENPDLFKVITTDNELKQLLVNYVGEKLNPENDQVTAEMVLQVLAAEFPEILLLVAEENFVRGYQQAMKDIDMFEKDTPTTAITDEESV